MKVTNVNGSSKTSPVCNCGSWKNHWNNYNGNGDSWPSLCREKLCFRAADVGAHVQRDGGTDKSWYIVPLCTKHNGDGGSLELVAGTALAVADQASTCKKSS